MHCIGLTFHILGRSNLIVRLESQVVGKSDAGGRFLRRFFFKIFFFRQIRVVGEKLRIEPFIEIYVFVSVHLLILIHTY